MMSLFNKKSLFLTLLISLSLIGCESDTQVPRIDYSKDTISKPELFAKGVISTDENSEFELTFSANGTTAYFSRRAPGEKQKIYRTEFDQGTWLKPRLAKFSTDRDETAMITPDGKYMFFGSERPVPNKPNKGNFDMNIWMMENTADGWGDPKPLPKPINEVQVEGEEWPSSNNNFLFTNDGQNYYYTTMKRGSNSIKLYKTTLAGENFSEPQVIEGLFEDEDYFVYSAVISPDGDYLVFNSYGVPDGAGGEDLFVAKRAETGWSKAKSIGTLVNTKDEESSPRFSRDGKYFFFSRAENLGNYEYGEWSIYYLETKYLQLNKLFE